MDPRRRPRCGASRPAAGRASSPTRTSTTIESALAWIGLVDWTYEGSFALESEEQAADRHELVFDGLDTVATVTVNGQVIAEVANQHRSYRLDVTDLPHHRRQHGHRRLPQPGPVRRRAERGAGCAPTPLPLAVQRPAQVGVQLRVGLGHRHLLERHLARGASGVLVGRPAERRPRPCDTGRHGGHGCASPSRSSAPRHSRST